MSENESFILSNAGLGFGEYSDADEQLHGEMNSSIKDPGLTETQFFGFSAPQDNVHGYGYYWHHPVLGTVTGGIQAWQGIKKHHLACEIYDMRAYQSDTQLPRVESFKMESGYAVEVKQPFKDIHISYSDPLRNNAVDINFTAVAPPAMLPNCKHFEQPMRSKGTVTLRGKTYSVDGYNIRDRSWAEVRPESPLSAPPAAWLTCTFNDDFSFNCMISDLPSWGPEWSGVYEINDEQVLKGGWILNKGEYTRVVAAKMRTVRNPETLCPLMHQLEVEDENGERISLEGRVIASSPSGFWSNALIHVSLIRWECLRQDGQSLVGWGDSQEAQWTDFVHARLR